MISQFSLNQQNNSNINSSSLQNKALKNKPSFVGREKSAGTLIGLVQKCEKEPMINVAVIDLLTAILPRSIWESLTNIFAGFEAFRRESSGLIVNCLIPGFITLGIAKLTNNMIMGKDKSKLANCWASSDTITKVTDHYKDAEKTEAFKDGMKIFNNEKHAKVYAVNYNLLNEASGIDGFKQTKFNEAMSKQELSDAAEKLTRISFKYKDNKLSEELVEKTPKKRLKAIFKSISKKTHVAQDVKFGAGLEAGLERTLTDTHQLVKGMVKEGIKPENVADFVKRSKRLLKTKSLLGMAVILPLAASMQHINRKITEKLSGVKGAPIHDNYGKEDSRKTAEEIRAEKASLIGRKIWAVSSMLGVAMLSMMKLPNIKTLKNIVQFKDQFPTMDQARAISAVTFASRMAVADDEAELKEAHTRDIVTFSSMYFLGDYGAKAMASHLEKKTGVELLNKTFDPAKNKGFFAKAKNWVLHTHLKSSDELRGVGKSLEEATKLRAKCQMANLGTSLALLGVVVPIYTRLRTKKHDAAQKAKMEALNANKTPVLAAKTTTHTVGSSGLTSRGLNQSYPTLKQFKTKVEVK